MNNVFVRSDVSQQYRNGDISQTNILYFTLHSYMFQLLERYHQQAVQNYKKEIES
jgi:hypothetical protein